MKRGKKETLQPGGKRGEWRKMEGMTVKRKRSETYLQKWRGRAEESRNIYVKANCCAQEKKTWKKKNVEGMEQKNGMEEKKVWKGFLLREIIR